MDNLIFCLNATMPIFCTMLLGYVFRQIGLMDGDFVKKLNRFVFKVALPMLLLEDMWEADFGTLWDGKFVGFCIGVTVISVLVCILLSRMVRDRNIRGEFVQAAFRSNTAILGIAFIQNIYGASGIAPLMLIGTVPFYNMFAVVVLSFMKPNRGKMDGKLIKDTLKGIVTNPIILGIVAGVILSVCSVPQVPIVQKSLHNLSVLATPLGLMAMGASFEGKKALAMIRPASGCTFVRLIGLAAIVLPLAILFGFRGEQIVSILVLSGSSSAVSSFIMAKNMGHEGMLTSSVVMMTTLGSAFTMTTWLYVLRSLGYV
ncbi:MAG: hypothetical protein EOM40_08195 [Clostridia bacterium]|nr:hypothetical protein [Clostridia bacterium]NCC43367.1 hypothetical protein [Clostridia bacterium]